MLLRYESEGRVRDAHMMLWGAATLLPAEDVLKVVSACHSAGLDDEASTVLKGVGSRDVHAAVAIAAAFSEKKLYVDAGVILEALAQGERGSS
ncbi:hypothetical protein [Streptomyces sp. 8L]|uniref:hypothetical protein n=1 Tax=Streptomyces sp. 8L TaxID=2877242 RepID=UPI001CD427A9|nr:hypothetical protein [Streptomyces sp. 8L]MCA1219925.1 hypothetical protein [Streptomyces sp. 8L]